MDTPLSYFPQGMAVLDRLRNLYEDRPQDRIFARMGTPSRAVEAFAAQYEPGYCAYPDPAERVAFWDAHLQERAAVEDDSVPSAYLSEFDQGLYGGLLGGEVQFMADPTTGWISSMVSPLLEDWSAFDRLSVDLEHEWFRRYRRQLQAFLEGAAGKFGISHFILIDSLNLVFEFFGATRAYEALIDQPDMVERAIDFAFDLNVTVQRTFFESNVLLEGGTCSNMVQWIPGRVVSESVDPFHMTSVDYFERWGRAPVQRMLDAFDGGVLHLHGNGRHLLETVSSLRGVKAIYFGDDTGFPPSFQVLEELRARAGDLPLVMSVAFEPFCTAMDGHRLVGGVLYQVQDVPDADAANRCMEKVRAYRQ